MENAAVHALRGISARRQAERLRVELAQTQRQGIEDLRRSRQETVERLTRAIGLRDTGTGDHVLRIAAISVFLGRNLGLSEQRIDLLRLAAPMHDIGKIGISDAIMLKPGPLTPKERTEMERHTSIGFDVLAGSSSELLDLAAIIALSHHERYDGAGYPRGLSGEDIPLAGRIVAGADVFDALLSDRPYRPALELSEALEVISDDNGTHFDSRVAELLLERTDEVLATRGGWPPAPNTLSRSEPLPSFTSATPAPASSPRRSGPGVLR